MKKMFYRLTVISRLEAFILLSVWMSAHDFVQGQTLEGNGKSENIIRSEVQVQVEAEAEALADEDSKSDEISWTEEELELGRQVLGVLDRECLQCHNPKKRKGRLDLSKRELWLEGRRGEPIFLKDNLCQSPVLVSFEPEADPHMPPEGQLTEEEIELFRRWLAADLPWPEPEVGAGVVVDIPLPIFEKNTRDDLLNPAPATYHPVFASAMRPDGNILAVGHGSEILLWDLTSKKPTLRYRAAGQHRDVVRALAWSPDGNQLVSGAFRELFVWDVPGPQTVSEENSENAPAEGSSQESSSALTALKLNQSIPAQAMVSALVWGNRSSADVAADVAAEEKKETAGEVVEGNEAVAVSVQPSVTRLWIAEGFPAQLSWIREWSVDEAKLIRSWQAHGDVILDMDLSPDGQLLATASADRLAKIWELNPSDAAIDSNSNNAPASRLMEAHSGQVWSIAFHPDGKSLITGSGDQEIKVWDVTVAAPTQSIQRISSGVTGVGWLDAGKEIFAICEDGAPRICRPDRDRPTRKLSRYGEGLRALAPTPDGKRWFGAGLNSRIYEWDTRGQLKNEMDPETAPETE